jgi:hypothetical protein
MVQFYDIWWVAKCRQDIYGVMFIMFAEKTNDSRYKLCRFNNIWPVAKFQYETHGVIL